MKFLGLSSRPPDSPPIPCPPTPPPVPTSFSETFPITKTDQNEIKGIKGLKTMIEPMTIKKELQQKRKSRKTSGEQSPMHLGDVFQERISLIETPDSNISQHIVCNMVCQMVKYLVRIFWIPFICIHKASNWWYDKLIKPYLCTTPAMNSVDQISSKRVDPLVSSKASPSIIPSLTPPRNTTPSLPTPTLTGKDTGLSLIEQIEKTTLETLETPATISSTGTETPSTNLMSRQIPSPPPPPPISLITKNPSLPRRKISLADEIAAKKAAGMNSAPTNSTAVALSFISKISAKKDKGGTKSVDEFLKQMIQKRITNKKIHQTPHLTLTSENQNIKKQQNSQQRSDIVNYKNGIKEFANPPSSINSTPPPPPPLPPLTPLPPPTATKSYSIISGKTVKKADGVLISPPTAKHSWWILAKFCIGLFLSPIFLPFYCICYITKWCYKELTQSKSEDLWSQFTFFIGKILLTIVDICTDVIQAIKYFW